MRTGLFISLLLLPFVLRAQTPKLQAINKGAWQMGLHAGYAKSRTSTQIHSGYFVGNNLLLGLEASWARERFNGLTLNSLRMGPVIRYQFGQGKISPFIAASYQLGKQRLDSVFIAYQSPNVHQAISLTPGLSFRLSSAWRIDLSYRLEYNQNRRIQRFGGQDFSTQRYIEYYRQPQLGINYLINKKR